MNRIYWHIQMGWPWGRNGEYRDPRPMLNLDTPIIGSGEWDSFQSRNFNGVAPRSLQVDDILLVRDGSRPLALCRVIGNMFHDTALREVFIHTNYREIEILDWYNGTDRFPQPQKTLERLINPHTRSYRFIDVWFQSLNQ